MWIQDRTNTIMCLLKKIISASLGELGIELISRRDTKLICFLGQVIEALQHAG